MESDINRSITNKQLESKPITANQSIRSYIQRIREIAAIDYVRSDLHNECSISFIVHDSYGFR